MKDGFKNGLSAFWAKFRDVRLTAIIFGFILYKSLEVILSKEEVIDPTVMGMVIGSVLTGLIGVILKLVDDSTPAPPEVTEQTHLEGMKIAANQSKEK